MQFKKIMAFILCILMIFSLVACGNKTEDPELNNADELENVEQETVKVDGETTVKNVTIDLISVETNKFDNMNFHNFTKSTLTPSDDGTAMTILITSDSEEIPLSQIEKVTIKSAKGGAVNMSTRTYMLNNKKACIVFAKTEGIHKASEYAVHLKTYDGQDRLMPISDKVNAENLKEVATPAGDAKFGDIITVKNEPYFILQSGSLSSTMFGAEDKKFSEVIIGTVLVPLNNSFTHKITTDDFTTQFFDNKEYGDYGVKTAVKINDKTMAENYADNFAGLFADLITCSFTIEVTDDVSQDQIVARRDYVMDNTWLKGTFTENFLYKIYSK